MCQNDFFLSKEILSIANANMFLVTLHGAAGLADGICQVYILQTGDWASVYTPAGHCFPTYIMITDWHHDSVKCAVLGFSEQAFCGKCQNTELFQVSQKKWVVGNSSPILSR